MPTAPNEISRVVLLKKHDSIVWKDNLYESRLVHEFKDFEDIWQAGDREVMNNYLDTSLNVMKVLEMAR